MDALPPLSVMIADAFKGGQLLDHRFPAYDCLHQVACQILKCLVAVLLC